MSHWTPGVGDGQEAWCAAIHGVAKSRTRLSDWSDLNFMAAVTTCSDFGAPKNIKSNTVSTVSPSISHEVMGPDVMIFVFWMLSFLQGEVFTRIYNHNVSLLRTVSGLNLLAKSVIIKCKLWEWAWWGLYNLPRFFWFIGAYITPGLTLDRGYSFCPLLMPMSKAFFISFIL